MGNYLSKKCCCCLTSRLNNSIFSSYKLISEDKDAYNEKEHSGHILLREIFKGNFCSPIRDVLFDPNTKVLDVGCGSGFWLMEMAADFQKPQYFGVDMFTIFPQSTYPNNIEFLRHNFLEGLPYEDNSFDFIHMQFLVCDFTESQWETFVYQELARVLKPGGWLEICDPEIEFINGGPITKRLNIAVRNNLLSKNFNPYMIQRHRLLINSIPSFSSSTVHHEKGYFPLSSHSSKIGELGGLHITENCKGILQGPVGRDMKIKKRHINSTIEKIALEFDTYSTYINIHRFYAQKG